MCLLFFCIVNRLGCCEMSLKLVISDGATGDLSRLVGIPLSLSREGECGKSDEKLVPTLKDTFFSIGID